MKGLGVLAAGLLLAACSMLEPMPTLVRDEAGMFSAAARADAEARLRELSAEHDILFFVVTDPRGDPPLAFREPMEDAGVDGRPAIVVVVDRNGNPSTAYSEGLPDPDDSFQPPDGFKTLLEDGRPDRALDLMVRSYGAWAGGR